MPNVNNNSLDYLETIITKYINKRYSESKFCSDIATALNNLSLEGKHKNFQVQISNTNGYSPFFGMRVFPSLTDMDAFCKAVINETGNRYVKFGEITRRWKNINNWVLEIDSLCFDRNSFNFIPKEIIALILHEMGHIIYSEKPVEIWYRAYQECSLRKEIAHTASEKAMYSIFMLPLTTACMQKEWVSANNNIKVEMIADKSVVDFGYGQYLQSAFEKIIKQVGSINYSEDANFAEVNTSMLWCEQNIVDINKRKNKLKDELYYQAVKAKSPYFKAVTIIILDKLGLKMREKYTGSVTESAMEVLNILNTSDWREHYEPIYDIKARSKFNKQLQAYESISKFEFDSATESVINKASNVKVKLPSQDDLNNLSIEINNITTHNDKIFVLDMIYEKIDQLDTYENSIKDDPMMIKKYQGKIDTIRRELDALKNGVINKPVSDSSQYKLVKHLQIK